MRPYNVRLPNDRGEEVVFTVDTNRLLPTVDIPLQLEHSGLLGTCRRWAGRLPVANRVSEQEVGAAVVEAVAVAPQHVVGGVDDAVGVGVG